MEQPKGNYTISEAAELWISMIQLPETKATQEQKNTLIAQIRAAAPQARLTGGSAGAASFAMACNAIKQVIRTDPVELRRVVCSVCSGHKFGNYIHGYISPFLQKSSRDPYFVLDYIGVVIYY